MSKDKLEKLLVSMGEPRFRAGQIFAALHEGRDYDDITNIPKALKDKLADTYSAQCVKIVKEQAGKTAQKYLLQMEDEKLVEAVYMHHDYGDTLCISTEIGCPMKCAFCASGQFGLDRKLTAGEMLSTVAVINRLKGGNTKKRAVTNIVMMGMGEPLDNYDECINFLRLVSAEGGLNISPRNISLSTAGVVPMIKKLAKEGLPVNLTISLHAPTDEIRDTIMPINKVYGIGLLLNACREYFEATKRRINIEYIMLDGINTGVDNAKKLAKLLRGLSTHVNLINFNSVDNATYQGVSKNEMMNFLKILEENGVSATTRRSLGADIEGACGQLKNRSVR